MSYTFGQTKRIPSAIDTTPNSNLVTVSFDARSGSAIYDIDNGTWGEGSQCDIKPTTGLYIARWTFGTVENWGVNNEP